MSWYGATAYCVWLSKKTGKKYRLPTEAEWEYAAKGGQSYTYSGSDNVKDVAWMTKNSGDTTHDVGGLDPNGFGLYDMSGNVWEWCSDWYGSYPMNAATDPKGSTEGSARIIRGGSWGWNGTGGAYCRAASRQNFYPYLGAWDIGFRIVLDPGR